LESAQFSLFQDILKELKCAQTPQSQSKLFGLLVEKEICTKEGDEESKGWIQKANSLLPYFRVRGLILKDM
jgi:hypothetical protein